MSNNKKSEINNWIKAGASLNEGIGLLDKYCPNPFFSRQLKLNPDRNRSMMNYLLGQEVGLAESDFDKLKKTGHEEKKHKKTHKKKVKKQAKAAKSSRRSNSPGRRTNKTTPKFREDYPFLNKHDCPHELKVLAADKISAWINYTEAHKKIPDATTKDYHSLARYIIENYKENRLIHQELMYYKEHGQVLGKHRIFARMKEIKELKTKNMLELYAQKKKLEHNIWRIQSEIQKGDKPHLLAIRERRKKEKEAKLTEINTLVNV